MNSKNSLKAVLLMVTVKAKGYRLKSAKRRGFIARSRENPHTKLLPVEL